MAATPASELHDSRVPVCHNQDRKREVADRVVVSAAGPCVKIDLGAASGEFVHAELPHRRY